MRLHSSNPPISGISQSVITTEGWCFANRSRASRPSFANNTRYRSLERECSTILRYIAESSTAKTVNCWEEGFMISILSLLGLSVRAEFCLSEFSGNECGQHLSKLL